MGRFAVLLSYTVATLVHHAHNAELLAEYPGMPSWLTRAGVYAAWLATTALGWIGYLLARRGRRGLGDLLMFLYAAYGLASLAHYVMAPPTAHSPGMHATIAFEVAMAALLAGELVRARRRGTE